MKYVLVALLSLTAYSVGLAQNSAAPPTPTDVTPGSITCEDVPYPYPVSYMPLTIYGQDIRLAYMDVAPQGTANGHTVMLFHGMNFAGFYWGGPIDALRKEGFRVVVVDQIGFGRSSKPIMPYNFNDMARNSRLLLTHLKIEKAMIVGHSMGGMLAARFATQYPDVAERVVIYNPIGLSDGRYDRPWSNVDEAYKRNLTSTYQGIYAGIARYFSHNPKAWKPEYEKYVRIRYAWTLSGDWPRYAMVQSLIQQVPYLDPVVYDWSHIKSPTLVFGGAEDSTAGGAKVFQERMKFVADSIPNGNGKLHLIPGLGHVPHFEAPEKTYPPLIAYLKEGVKR
ncbi:MAG TPA: alpha/beta hydrolase [Steroidobacteraceae bacterium]|nr:alpha/beta hydrolase [Steroidobacteraceae bacterium]